MIPSKYFTAESGQTWLQTVTCSVEVLNCEAGSQTGQQTELCKLKFFQKTKATMLWLILLLDTPPPLVDVKDVYVHRQTTFATNNYWLLIVNMWKW